MKFIGNKISFQKTDGIFTVVISPKIARIKESLLMAWLTAWTMCGIFFIIQLFGPDTRDTKMTIAVMVMFWAYFELRIGKAFLWRKIGLERIMIKDGYLTIKNDIKGYGKAKSFFVQNIKSMGLINVSNRNFFNFMNSSFWVIGGETIGFECEGKYVKLGQHLNEKDAKSLVRLLQSEMKVAKKSA